FTASTTCLHSSIESPMGCNLSSRYDNGIELSRWPMVKVPVSFTFFSVPSRPCVLPGADTPASKAAVTMTPIAVFMTLLLTCWTRMFCDQRLIAFGRCRVDCLAETFDDRVDGAGIDDERRRKQDVVAAHAVRRAAHGIDHQPARHRLPLHPRV